MFAGPVIGPGAAVDAAARIAAVVLHAGDRGTEDVTGGRLQDLTVPDDVAHGHRALHDQTTRGQGRDRAAGDAHGTPDDAEVAVVAVRSPFNLDPGLAQDLDTGIGDGLGLFRGGRARDIEIGDLGGGGLTDRMAQIQRLPRQVLIRREGVEQGEAGADAQRQLPQQVPEVGEITIHVRQD